MSGGKGRSPADNLKKGHKQKSSGQEKPQLKRLYKNVTLNVRVFIDMWIVARYLNMPMATLLRSAIEAWHRSSSFGTLLARAKKEGPFDPSELAEVLEQIQSESE